MDNFFSDVNEQDLPNVTKPQYCEECNHQMWAVAGAGIEFVQCLNENCRRYGLKRNVTKHRVPFQLQFKQGQFEDDSLERQFSGYRTKKKFIKE